MERRDLPWPEVGPHSSLLSDNYCDCLRNSTSSTGFVIQPTTRCHVAIPLEPHRDHSVYVNTPTVPTGAEWSKANLAILALVVSTLGSFRQLFVKNEQARNAQPGIEHQSTTRRLFSTFGSKAWSAKSGQSNARSELPWMDRHRPAQSDTSAEHIMPLERIHVGHKIGVSIDPITEGGDSLEALGYGTHSHAYARQS